MSKIQTELMEATGLKAVRNEDRQDLVKRIMKAVGGLTDKEWEKLSGDAQDWFNAAADDQNAKKKVLPDFPDLEEAGEEEQEEAPTSRRRGAGKEEAKADVKPKVGVIAKVTTKRGKSYTGKIVELDDDVIVLKMGNGEEEELDRSRVESIEVAGGEAAEAEAEDPIKVGAEVTVLTKRGKEVTGKIVELDDEVIVLDVDGKDEELSRDRVESIKPVKAAKAETSSRRGAGKEEPAADEKPKRASNAEGVSIGTRIKELIAEDFEASEADIAKTLKKEGIDFKDNTLKLNYVDCHKFITILKAKKRIK